MRLQLIRYESVELTEQLMRERQNRQAEDEDLTEDQPMEEESPEAAPSELHVGLRGVLLEEQRVEDPVSTKEGVQYEL